MVACLKMMLLKLVYHLSVLVVISNAFEPTCDRNNQFRFYCFPVEYCTARSCDNNKCGLYPVNSKIVTIKETKFIPKCAFVNSPNIQFIYGSNSKIEVIANGAFKNLSNVDKIDLSLNRIRELHRGIFKNVLASSVDFSWNKLIYIEEGAFDGLHNLKNLNLSKNELTTIPIHRIPMLLSNIDLSYNLFDRILLTSKKTPSLTNIDLSNNAIDKLALSFNGPLQKVNLNHNFLADIDYMDVASCEELRIALNRFKYIPDVFSFVDIKSVSLYPNPWKCDELQNLWLRWQSKSVKLIDEKYLNNTNISLPVCFSTTHKSVLELFRRKLEASRSSCETDSDCNDNMICRALHCWDPCKENLCDSSSICKVENHQMKCTCPEELKRNPLDPYSTCQDVQCFINRHCSKSSGYCKNNQCMTYLFPQSTPRNPNEEPASPPVLKKWWEYEI